MEHAIVAARMTYIKYHTSLIHNINDSGEFRMRDLPLVDAPNAKAMHTHTQQTQHTHTAHSPN